MSEAPIVRVEQGQLRGKIVPSPSGKHYFSFQKIPYAKPPIGLLRFKDPEPHEPWKGILDATSEAPVAPQKDFLFAPNYVGDENCLYLNVYSSKLSGSSPAMFYIHGGGFTSGSGNTNYYGPDYLVEKDVVVVTINYRLGPLGFLCLNTPEVPGNAGLKDVILALRWVKQNIHNFGGNADNVTIFGESAGGAITTLLTTTPVAKGLFSKGIAQSGTAFINIAYQRNPVENARKLAKALGCESNSVKDVLEFLRAKTAKEIIETNATLSSFETIADPNFFTIVAEKEFPGIETCMAEDFSDLLTSGRFTKVPIMVGSTTLESGFDQSDLQQCIPRELNIQRDSPISLSIVKQMKSIYYKGVSELIGTAQLQSDCLINVGIHRYIQLLLQSSNVPVYFYKFDYVGSLNIRHELFVGKIKDKANHLDELGYLFKNDFQKDVEPTPQDLKVRERMLTLWTNFAKTGNPTPEVSHLIPVMWPPVTKDQENFLLIGNELTTGVGYDQHKMDFWDALYRKHYRNWEQPELNPAETREDRDGGSNNIVKPGTEQSSLSHVLKNAEAKTPAPIVNARGGVDHPNNSGVHNVVNFYESLNKK